MKIRMAVSAATFVAAGMVVASPALAGIQYVTSLGASSGWYSDDTRSESGVVLNGLNSSFAPYFGGAPGTIANDTAIAQQIYFTDTGTTTTGGDGVMVLDGTTSNSGKSSVKYYDLNGLATGASLANFTSTFRWYMDNYTTSRTPALSLAIAGSNSALYTLVFVGTGAQTQSWNTFSVDADTAGVWYLYGSGAPGGTTAKSLNEWLADATYGAALSGGMVYAQGFNIGSFQRQCRVGIDWLESSILNGGDRIDFGVIPSPGAIALLGLAGLAGRRRR